ncbi:Guanylate cyclase [Seminavis robusta]|uniref:Guanylate cyclase n=1 Tax=Seminavis robusta TaxID=568900 RepID=A0A9N8E033_9STRA|nr:Guanylate cyclase [Seminavis robusta]|eukprot:Sro516_g158460.1 Guanylate cyclase (1307) ;mRNA; r:12304-16303
MVQVLTAKVGWMLLLVSLLSLSGSCNASTMMDSNAETCLSDGTCQADPKASTTSTTTKKGNSTASVKLQCGLFLAESSIPKSGWGMYTGVDLQVGKEIPPLDVMIPVVDSELHRTLMQHYKRLSQTIGTHIRGKHGGFGPSKRNSSVAFRDIKVPKWLMEQYYWDSSMTHNWYDAEKIDSVVPGLGMLANSHPGMILCENDGPSRPNILGGHVVNGAGSSPYQNQAFLATTDVPAGHELFVEYGDSWFEERFDKSFGLSDDYARSNVMVEKWQTSILDTHRDKQEQNSTLWDELEQLLLQAVEPLDPRLHEVLGRLDLVRKNNDTKRFAAKDNPAAYAAVPQAPRSVEWLYQEGMCLDHIAVYDSYVAPGEKGAFAARDLPKGTLVAPAPVVHMSRDHLTMLLMDTHDSDIVLWKGMQLLLNYCYGHKDSSLVFFPYSPSVNLLNHYGKTTSGPNVKLQWSSKMPHPEWLEWTPEQVVQEQYKAGMVMEIVALEDIPQGAELVLDYGDAWQEAFEEHARTTPRPPELQPVDINLHDLLTVNDQQKYPPHVETVCWIHKSQHPHFIYNHRKLYGGKMPEAWLPWVLMKTDYLSDTVSCDIVGKRTDGASYNVVLKDTIQPRNGGEEIDVDVRITNVPRRAITVVPLVYTSAELRRDSFRHEIQLPEEMVPEQWRDLKETTQNRDEESQCHLYMAESAIPNAGWGIYRGYAAPMLANNTNDLDHFCEDMVIQVEDFTLNQVLRNRFHKQAPDSEMDSWILDHYAWSGDITKGGNLEAEKVQSFSPGCGMLANAYPMLYNAHKMPPSRLPINTTDPSLGATTHYHSGMFVEQYLKQGKNKIRTLQNGMEIVVKATEEWLESSKEEVLGKLPFRRDFMTVDKVMRSFLKLTQTHSTEATDLLWKLLWNTVEGFQLKRIASVLPRNPGDIKEMLTKGGSAKYTLRDRVREPEWLETHGSCVDNIRPGPSTIDMAGNGAFATRKLAEGSVISPLPLIHVHRQHMDLFNGDSIRDPNKEVWQDGKQLVLNYMYGHAESNLLLFPYSPVVNYINHANSTAANAKLQWSSKFNSEDWLQKSPEELLRHHKTAGLAFDLVATREIAAGEEVLLDYGPEWESAWRKHVENWALDPNWSYEPPVNEWLDWMPTEREIDHLQNRQTSLKKTDFQFERPDKFLGCHVKLPDVPIPPVYDENGVLPEFEWTPVDGMFRTTSHVFPCEVVDRLIDGEHDIRYAVIRKDSVAPLHDLYSAIVTVHPGNHQTPPRRFVSYDMPRRAIEIFDEEYSSPQFYKGAFRHPIGIPNDLMPDAWRDLKS